MNFDKLKPLAEALPENVRANALALVERMGEVVEGIGDREVHWRPTVLKLVQATSDRQALPKGANIGDFVLGETKLDQPVTIIPLRSWDGRQRWDPDQANNRILCSSPDAKYGFTGQECKTCPYQVWNEVEGKSECSKIKSVLVIASDLSDVFLINFAKSSYSAGTDFESLMKKANVYPYRRIYGLSSKPSTKAKNVELLSVGLLPEKERATPDEHLPFLKELFDQVNTDRKEMLVKFQESIAQKRLAMATTGVGQQAIGNDAQSADSSLANPPEEGEVSPMSRGYSI